MVSRIPSLSFSVDHDHYFTFRLYGTELLFYPVILYGNTFLLDLFLYQSESLFYNVFTPVSIIIVPCFFLAELNHYFTLILSGPQSLFYHVSRVLLLIFLENRFIFITKYRKH
jgi:hypothetical protein